MTEGNVPPAAMPAGERVVYVQPPPERKRGVLRSILIYIASGLIIFSILMNLVLLNWLTVLAGEGDGVKEEYISGGVTSSKKVAIVSVSGLIADSGGGLFADGGNFRHVMRQLKKAREDDKVVSVVLEVNSPGGSITASDTILHEVERTKKAGKKIVVWMGGVAASGGYYVSCKADTIYAHPTTLTGSIGVIMGLYNVEELADKIGVRPVLIKRGEFKDMGSAFRGMTEPERRRFEALAEGAYRRFKEMIKEGRKLSDTQVNLIADGAIIDAQEAVARGLVDKIGYLEEAIAEAKGENEKAAVVRYRRSVGLLSAILSKSAVPSGDVRLHVDTPLPRLAPGLHYLWLPGAGVTP